MIRLRNKKKVYVALHSKTRTKVTIHNWSEKLNLSRKIFSLNEKNNLIESVKKYIYKAIYAYIRVVHRVRKLRKKNERKFITSMNHKIECAKKIQKNIKEETSISFIKK